MSLQSWKEEFYPVEAIHATSTPLEAAEHSLRKWCGALADNLNTHGVDYEFHEVSEVSQEPLEFNAKTCALCRLCSTSSDSAGWPNADCRKCPLALVRDGISCDHELEIEGESPFDASINDPSEMIYWLEKTVAYCKEREQK